MPWSICSLRSKMSFALDREIVRAAGAKMRLCVRFPLRVAEYSVAECLRECSSHVQALQVMSECFSMGFGVFPLQGRETMCLVNFDPF